MKKINIRRTVYHVRHNYFTLNNVVIAVAFVIAAGWIWGSLSAMQRNYNLQKEVDFKKQQLQVAQLQTANLQLQQRYYGTAEYQELAARQSLDLALPGERQLILPPNTKASSDQDTTTVATTNTTTTDTTDLEQWINFLFGGYSKTIDQQ